jgi:predicted O-methyltransferase YrrM
MKLIKRIKQAIALLTHPGSLLNKYDTPWDNVIFSDIRKLYDNNQIETCLFEELVQRLDLQNKPGTVSLRHLHESHRTTGSISPLELRVICELARMIAPKNVLEIGTFEGRTTLNLALNLPESKIYTLNLPQESCSFQVGKYFHGAEEAGRITQLFGNSREFDFSGLPRMDLVFVDGDHSYDGVVSDSENAFNVLAEDGIILWHDFDTCHLATTKAVLDAVAKHDYSYCNIEGTSLALAYKNQP